MSRGPDTIALAQLHSWVPWLISSPAVAKMGPLPPSKAGVLEVEPVSSGAWSSSPACLSYGVTSFLLAPVLQDGPVPMALLLSQGLSPPPPWASGVSFDI